MIRQVLDEPARKENYRRITFEYNQTTDEGLLDKIKQFISDNQNTCSNCQNLQIEGEFCGYNACHCIIHGNIEAYDNPHHDEDGTKCSDYKRIKSDNQSDIEPI